MKSQKGVTLSSLIIYIIVMIMVIGIMSRVSVMFYTNVNKLDNRTIEISKFNDFNAYFIKEIKKPNNGIDKIDNINKNYILFKSGNSFLFQNHSIYYNDLLIVDNVQSVIFDINQNDNTVINVNIRFNEYSKNMNYKIEEIY